ncbi:MAG: 2-phosphosulfolactate phosphatase [Bacteroidota bacterium]
MKSIDVCLSPELVHLYNVNDKVVVVVDILRATSCMVAGIANGVESITPFANLEACRAMKEQGYFIAGERNGQKVEGFDIGNSPYSYMADELKGQRVAVTTTNGTVAIEKSKEAIQVIIGAFLNLSAVVNYLKSQENDVLILCAGWKGKVNLEDTLYAGALAEQLQGDFQYDCDAPLAAQAIYNQAKDDLLGFLANSSHVNRLKRLNIQKDIEFCLEPDQFEDIPVLVEGKLIRM